MPRSSSYATQAEIDYIDGLGTWRTGYAGYDTIELLEDYLKIAKRRNDWGNIDAVQAMTAAKRRIRRLELCNQHNA